jgi:hypothetical protein
VTVAEPLLNSLSGRCCRSGLPSADTRQSRTCGQTPLRARVSCVVNPSGYPHSLTQFWALLTAARRSEASPPALPAAIRSSDLCRFDRARTLPPPSRMRVGGERRPSPSWGSMIAGTSCTDGTRSLRWKLARHSCWLSSSNTAAKFSTKDGLMHPRSKSSRHRRGPTSRSAASGAAVRGGAVPSLYLTPQQMSDRGGRSPLVSQVV